MASKNIRRRELFFSLARYSVVAATASVASSAMTRSRDLAERSIDNAGKKLESIRKRVDSLENKQKNLARALVLVTAVSTAIDLSIML